MVCGDITHIILNLYAFLPTKIVFFQYFVFKIRRAIQCDFSDVSSKHYFNINTNKKGIFH